MFDKLSMFVAYISEQCTLKHYLPPKNIYTRETVERVWIKNQSPRSVLIFSYVQTACKCILNAFKNANTFDHQFKISFRIHAPVISRPPR